MSVNLKGTIAFEFFDIINNTIILIHGNGLITTLVHYDNEIISQEKPYLKEYLENSKKAFWGEEKILFASFFNDELFIIPSNHNLLIYNLINNSIKEVEFPLKLGSMENHLIRWSDCLNLFVIDKFKIMLFIRECYNFGTDKDPMLESLAYFKIVDRYNFADSVNIVCNNDMYCNKLIVINNHIYYCSTTQLGSLIKHNIYDNTVSFIEVFRKRFHIIEMFANNSKIICSDYLRIAIIDSNTSEDLKFIDLGVGIKLIRVSTCGNYFGILNNEGDLIIYEGSKYSVVCKFNLAAEAIDYNSLFLLIINYPYIYMGDGRILNIYK